MVKIKICGIMTEEDCEIMNCYHPDYCGFVFAGEKHKLTDQKAGRLRNILKTDIPAVGVFVNEPINHIIALYQAGIIQVIQLHGNEDSAYIQRLYESIKMVEEKKINTLHESEKEIQVIKAIRAKSTKEIAEADKISCDMLLIDTYDKKVAGGSGKRFDINIIPKMHRPYIIAGGINAENMMDIMEQTDPYAIDISSGAETDGHKDWHKTEKIIQNMKKYNSEKIK